MAGRDTLPSYSKPHESSDTEERKGLLSDDYSEKPEPNTQPNAWSTRKIVVAATTLIGLLITGAVARTLLIPPPPSHPNLFFHGGALRSNGTHNFRRTVLMVSIDGLRCVCQTQDYNMLLMVMARQRRADYLDRGFTPHLLDISKQGLRAKSMRPIFPVSPSSPIPELHTKLHVDLDISVSSLAFIACSRLSKCPLQ